MKRFGLVLAMLALGAVLMVGPAAPVSAHGGGLPFYGIVEIEGLQVEAGVLVVTVTADADVNAVRTTLAENGIALIEQRDNGTIAGLVDVDITKMLEARAFARRTPGVADASFEPPSPDHLASTSTDSGTADPSSVDDTAVVQPEPTTAPVPSPWSALAFGASVCVAIGAVAALLWSPASNHEGHDTSERTDEFDDAPAEP